MRLAPIHAVFVPLAFAAIGAAQAPPVDGVRLQPGFVAGQSQRYSFDAAFTRKRGIEPQAPAVTLSQHAELRLDTISVDADGSATIRVAIENLRFELMETDAPGRRSVFTWQDGKPSADGPAAEAMTSVGSALASCTPEVVVRSNGKIASLNGLIPAFRAAAADKSETQALGLFSREAVEHNLEQLWAIDPDGAGRTRGTGAAWSLDYVTPLLVGKTVVFTTEYTLKGIADGIAEIGGGMRATVRPPKGDPNPAVPDISIAEQSGDVRVKWDAAAGRLVSRVSDRVLVFKTSLPLAEPIETTAYTSSHLEIKLLADR